VLEDVIPTTVLASLAPVALAEAAAMVAHGAWDIRGVGQMGQGHLQQGLPRSGAFVHSDVVANPIIEQVAHAILRDVAVLGFYGGNCSMPGSGTQPLHSDGHWCWQTPELAAGDGEPWPHRTVALHCNFSTTGDVMEENGATEVWPCSHHAFYDGLLQEKLELAESGPQQGVRLADNNGSSGSGSGSVWSAATLEEQRRQHPPARNHFPWGAVAFRDNRIWHRGVPNRTDTPRHNGVLIYYRQRHHVLHRKKPMNRIMFSEDAR
jgi:hypothetical protein